MSRATDGRLSERYGLGQSSIHVKFLAHIGGHHLETDMVGTCVEMFLYPALDSDLVANNENCID